MKKKTSTKRIISIAALLVVSIFAVSLAMNWDDFMEGFNQGFNDAKNSNGD